MPHVSEQWTTTDFIFLSVPEIEGLLQTLSRKLYDLQNEYERRTTFRKQERDLIVNRYYKEHRGAQHSCHC